MKRLTVIFGITFVVGMACQSSSFAQSGAALLKALEPPRVVSWQKIQQLGGLKIGQIEQTRDGLAILPIDCDISGLKEITVRPTAMDSSHVASKVTSRIKDHKIYLAVVSQLASGGTSKLSSKCPDAVLQKIEAGRYEVVYDDKKSGYPELGKINIAEKKF